MRGLEPFFKDLLRVKNSTLQTYAPLLCDSFQTDDLSMFTSLTRDKRILLSYFTSYTSGEWCASNTLAVHQKDKKGYSVRENTGGREKEKNRPLLY
ncbi:hypothetical protein ANTQUA_LOCUS6981 [Anthophora quadrimaculata]